MNAEQPDIVRATRRLAGISALRKLRRLVDEVDSQERREARWALGIGAAFVLAASGFIIWLLGRAG